MSFSTEQRTMLPASARSAGLRSAIKRPRGVVRARLLDAAERLFGQNGVEGVSLREIALAAGQRNVSAVIYHFKDKKNLVEALINDRLIEVEAGRQSSIEKIENLDACGSADLLEIMLNPIIDICIRRGGSWFIKFHLSYFLHNSDEKHPFVSMPEHFPASNKLLTALRACASHLPLEQYQCRLSLIFVMFWMAISRYDIEAEGSNLATVSPLTEPIKVAVAALAAPA